MSEISGNPKSPKVIKSPDSIKREDFMGEVSYRLAIEATEIDRVTANSINTMKDSDILLPSLLESAGQALTNRRRDVEIAQADYESTLGLFKDTERIFKFGTTVTFSPLPGCTLRVMRWGGSEYSERHVVERILEESDTFDVLSLSWDHTDGMLKGYDSSVAGDTRSSWVELPFTELGPTYQVVAIDWPEIVIEGEEGKAQAVDPEQEELEAIDARFYDKYLAFFSEHPEADWVMIGDTTEEIYGSGTDSQIPNQTAYAEMESHLKEKVHLIGRPVVIG